MKKKLYNLVSILIIMALTFSSFLLAGCDDKKEKNNNNNENKFGLMKFSQMSGGADEQAQKLKKEILSAPDTLKKATEENLVYYVSVNGSEWNDGLSPEKPTTIDEVNTLYLTRGDMVLFKRGDTFRLEKEIKPVRGVSYGAYGEGDKPILLGSLKNYADKSLWSSEDNKIWQIYLGTNDAAQVIFNDCEYVGFRKHTLAEVTANGDFFYDYGKKTLFLYLTDTNPGEYFNSIEIATTSRAIGTFGAALSKLDNLKFQNLCIKYFTLFAFNMSYVENMEITGCEMSYIGGAITSSKKDRYGNAVQFWNCANNVNVSNNYIHQIFDAAITFQGTATNKYTNLEFKNNLIEYTSMNFEFWGQDNKKATGTSSDPTAKMHNISFENNILRFGGYGFGGMQRKIRSNQAFVLCWYNRYDESQIKDFNITNNIFDTANCNYFYAPNTINHVNVANNTYYQKPGSEHYIIVSQKDNCDSKDEFEKIIKKIDKSPKKVEWIE
jgi:hypothetical protein